MSDPMPMPVSADSPVVEMRPTSGWIAIRPQELWEYRELLAFLIWRDLAVRYRQTILGVSWAILQPFCMMLIFTVFFGLLVAVPSDGIPYPLFAFAGLVPWTLFAQGLTLSSNSLVANQALIRKVYFPRLVLPMASVASTIVDFALAFVVLLGLMAWYHRYPGANVVWLPPLFLLAVVTSLGAGLWFSALNVLYRDIQYVVPFVVQVWLFSTPVVYSSSLIPEQWRAFYGLNPMAGVIEGFRWALFGSGAAPGPMMLVSAGAATAMSVGGLYFFRRMEKTFSDVV
jgi:lipopolysaccharide transport system permease protein